MTERLHRYYQRGEDYVQHYSDCATAAAALLGWAWEPREGYDDGAREQQRYFLSSGELTHLAFDGAAVYHDEAGRFASTQIVLRSSTRLVTIRVCGTGGNLTAEKVLDRVP